MWYRKHYQVLQLAVLLATAYCVLFRGDVSTNLLWAIIHLKERATQSSQDTTRVECNQSHRSSPTNLRLKPEHRPRERRKKIKQKIPHLKILFRSFTCWTKHALSRLTSLNLRDVMTITWYKSCFCRMRSGTSEPSLISLLVSVDVYLLALLSGTSSHTRAIATLMVCL